VLQKIEEVLMKFMALVVMLLIGSATAAETLQAEGYNFIFEMNKPHQIENNQIKTFDGGITFNNLPISAYINDPRIGEVMGEPISYGVWLSHGLYVAVPLPGNFTVISSMNLGDTVDFLKGLKIEPLNQDN
jgi:hypothetical protein